MNIVRKNRGNNSIAQSIELDFSYKISNNHIQNEHSVIEELLWSPHGNWFAVKYKSGEIDIYSGTSGDFYKQLFGCFSSPFLAFNEDETKIVYCNSENDLEAFELRTNIKISSNYKIFKVYALTFDKIQDCFICTIDGGILKWRPEKYGRLIIPEYHAMPFSLVYYKIVIYNEKIKTYAFSGESSKIVLYNIEKHEEHTISGHQGHIKNMAFNIAGTLLATFAMDEPIQIWNLQNKSKSILIEGYFSSVISLNFSGDDNVLAVVVDDGKLCFFNVQTGIELKSINRKFELKATRLIRFHTSNSIIAISQIQNNFHDQIQNDEIIFIKISINRFNSNEVKQNKIYISAKVVLVGESNVGKSYLAHRIATKKSPKAGTIQSTHGMRFWPLRTEQLSSNIKSPDGQQREIILWDMGGQQDYRLIHQLFLYDTTLAIFLLDPTRGESTFNEIRIWNNYLHKQLRGKNIIKLLVGSKLDTPTDLIDRSGLEQLISECGFSGFFETSALNGRGISKLSKAIVNSIDWNDIGFTSRPELFQTIRDEIELKRLQKVVVLHIKDILRLIIDTTSTEEELFAIDIVTRQLARQGLIARSQTLNNETIIVLQVNEIERYAGSIIIAARNNPRGVPAFELGKIYSVDFSFPGIAENQRLPRLQERSVLECTIQIMLENGLCFVHEGLLIFPTLFTANNENYVDVAKIAVSLCYDFTGAIDNIYASLVSWLVLAKNFGRVRLWADKAEFEDSNGGLCGLYKTTRKSGIAHLDIYFEENTPSNLKDRFIAFVDEHLKKHGIEISEKLIVTCPKEYIFDQETLRIRVDQGAFDVLCPRCEQRHSFSKPASILKERDSQIITDIWGLKTAIEFRCKEDSKKAIKVISDSIKQMKTPADTIKILHLSDLHFDENTDIRTKGRHLIEDVKWSKGLAFSAIEYLVVTGDFTHKGNIKGFEKALEYISYLTSELNLSAERCILVPGNHDLTDPIDAYNRVRSTNGLKTAEWIQKGEIILKQDPLRYPSRFKEFSESFYHKLLFKEYPMEYSKQGMSIPFWDTGIQFLTLNSCWQIDEFNRNRAGINNSAIANLIEEARNQEKTAIEIGDFTAGRNLLRIGVWHHSVTAPDFKMGNIDFLDHLQNINVRLALHGDVHELRRDVFKYYHKNKMHILGSGSYGAVGTEKPESTPRLYNLIEIKRDLKSIRVHTRCQKKENGKWEGWYEWDKPGSDTERISYYDIDI